MDSRRLKTDSSPTIPARQKDDKQKLRSPCFIGWIFKCLIDVEPTGYHRCVAIAEFRFYGELNDFLPLEKRQNVMDCPFNPPETVKHLIEAQGVPHPEVALILANGQETDFTYFVRHDDRLAVYPASGFSPDKSLRPALPHPPGFVLDNHLGRLARYLRLLGFDTLYPREHLPDEELAQLSHDQGRVMLTRDRRLLMRNTIVHGYCLRTTDPKQQLDDVIRQFQLSDVLRPWQRCLHCNGLLQPVPKEAIEDRLEPKTRKYYHEFQMCSECGKIYWQGSHFDALKRIIDSV